MKNIVSFYKSVLFLCITATLRTVYKGQYLQDSTYKAVPAEQYLQHSTSWTVLAGQYLQDSTIRTEPQEGEAGEV